MNIANLLEKLPHRLLINQSLRNTADDLRREIDLYHNQRVKYWEKCEQEIQRTKETSEERILHSVMHLVEDIENEHELVSSLQNNLHLYAQLDLQRQLLQHALQASESATRSANDSIGYLNRCMATIGEEIQTLNEQRAILSKLVDIEDISTLMILSNGNALIGEFHDAKELLLRVNEQIKLCSNNETKFALMVLRNRVQERVEYLPYLEYIDWLIQQQTTCSKDYKRIRTDEIAKKKECLEVSREFKRQLRSNWNELYIMARKIRLYWMEPKASLMVDVSYDSSQLQNLYQQLNEIKKMLEEMVSCKSSDSARWNELQELKQRIKNQISMTRTHRDSLKRKVKDWNTKKDRILSVLRANGIELMRDGSRTESDEFQLVSQRLLELETKSQNPGEDAKQNHELERTSPLEDRKSRMARYEQEIQRAEVLYAEAKKMMSEYSPGFDTAELERVCYQLLSVRKQLELRRNAIRRHFNRKLNTIPDNGLNATERLEMEKLQLRKQVLLDEYKRHD